MKPDWTGGTVAPEDFNPRPATAIGSGYVSDIDPMLPLFCKFYSMAHRS